MVETKCIRSNKAAVYVYPVHIGGQMEMGILLFPLKNPNFRNPSFSGSGPWLPIPKPAKNKLRSFFLTPLFCLSICPLMFVNFDL